MASHPVWVRGLKPYLNSVTDISQLSHPVWVRGLKRLFVPHRNVALRRTPCGCVD